ncbi:MAG: tetratricopeptide repeat protein [Myxococcota bacterium]
MSPSRSEHLRLVRFLTRPGPSGFALAVARYDDRREGAWQRNAAELAIEQPVTTVDLADASPSTPITTLIERQWRASEAPVVFVVGLEHLLLDQFGHIRPTDAIRELNVVRDSLPRRVPARVVLWLSDAGSRALATLAADLQEVVMGTFDFPGLYRPRTSDDGDLADPASTLRLGLRLEHDAHAPLVAPPGEQQRVQREIEALEKLFDRREQDPTAAAETASRLGRLYESAIDYEASIRWRRQAIERFTSTGTWQRVAEEHQALATLYRLTGSIQQARSALERAALTASRGNDNEQLAMLHIQHARLNILQGDLDKAQQHLGRAQAVADQWGHRDLEGAVLLEEGRISLTSGEPKEAIERFERALVIFDELGDSRQRAVTLGDIAHLRADKGEVDQALALHNERLTVFDKLGDARSRAGVLVDIARLRAAYKGEIDQALALHNLALETYERLGDVRSRAVTLVDIARLRADNGEVDQALALYHECLAVFDKLGDKDGRANTLWSIGQIAKSRGERQLAYDSLAESYELNLELGRLDGIVLVGLDLSILLAQAGENEQARVVLERSRSGFLRWGRDADAAHVQSILDSLDGAPLEDP